MDGLFDELSARAVNSPPPSCYEVMQSYVMHKPANDPIFTFIEKKRGEGKSGKLAMVAGLNKFLRVYYGKVTELYRSLPAIE